jgi:hypothetical protein
MKKLIMMVVWFWLAGCADMTPYQGNMLLGFAGAANSLHGLDRGNGFSSAPDVRRYDQTFGPLNPVYVRTPYVPTLIPTP